MRKSEAARKKRARLDRARVRAQMARLYLRGLTQAEIGVVLKVTQQQVSKELVALRAEWLALALHEYDAAKAEALAKIDHIEATCWERFEASIGEVQTKVQHVRAGADGKPAPERMTITTSPGLGDKRWLDGVQWCISKRCEILGLDAPKAVGIVNDFDPEEWKKGAEKRMAQAMETLALFDEDEEAGAEQ